MIKTRRKNNVGKGGFIGALSGFVLGGIIGIASSQSYSEKGGHTIGGGFIGAIVGTGFGLIAGSSKLNTPIQGQIGNYYRNYSKLEKRAIKKRNANSFK